MNDFPTTATSGVISESSTDNEASQLREVLFEICMTAGMDKKELTSDISAKSVMEALKRIKKMLPSNGNLSANASEAVLKSSHLIDPMDLNFAIVVGSLGIINFQIQQMLKKICQDVSICRSVDIPLDEFQNKDFQLVVIDLFMPNEQEGFAVLDKVKLLKTRLGLDYRVIVLIPSAQVTPKLRESVFSRGADSCIIREDGWQKQLLESILNTKP